MEKVLLCNMPWGKTDFPSIQLSVLKSSLASHGLASDILYQNITFAEMIGVDFYFKMSSSSQYSFLMEWLFNGYLVNNGREDNEETWETSILDLINLRKINPYLTSDLKIVVLKNENNYDESLINSELARVCKDARKNIIPRFFFNMMNTVRFDMYDIIGFTCSFSQMIPVLACALIIKKKYPNKIIILGGNAVSGDMGIEYLKRFSQIDCIIYGEGEISLYRLVEYLRKNNYTIKDGHDLAGVIYRDGEQRPVKTREQEPCDLNMAPLPDYDEYFKRIAISEKQYGSRIKYNGVLYESSRGCFWGEKTQCKFCGLNGEHLNFRHKDWKKVYADIKELSLRYRCNTITCVDNILDFSAYKPLFGALKEDGIDLTIFWEVKPNIKRDDLQRLAHAGCTNVQAGLESLSTDILKLIGKGTTRLINICFLRDSYEAGIDVSYNYLFGFPGEAPECYMELPALFSCLHHLISPLYPPRPMVLQRFSAYFNAMDEYGIRAEPAQQYELLYPNDMVTVNKIACNYAFDCDKVPEDLGYVETLFESTRAWSVDFRAEHRPVLAYEKGNEYVKIYDTRFGREQAYIIRGLGSFVYLFCRQPGTRASIMREVKSYYQDRENHDACSEEAVDNVLAVLLSKKILIEEHGQYLSLAYRLKDIVHRLPTKARVFIANTQQHRSYEEI
jgi:ribosomal peptide maturation radical SAM protein 1